MLRVLIYKDSRNLGDAIQTLALCRLLGEKCYGVYRDLPIPDKCQESPLIVNGYLGFSAFPLLPRNAVIAGIHIAGRERELSNWIRSSGEMTGARDPYTQHLLESARVKSEMIGCATLTFERYRGVRSRRYSIDVSPRPNTITLTNSIGPIPWKEQWELAETRLQQLRTAEIVYTNRLHVILPCLAFGAPVEFPLKALSGLFEKARISLLNAINFPYDAPVELDVSSFSERYCSFLERRLNRCLRPSRTPECPLPISEAEAPHKNKTKKCLALCAFFPSAAGVAQRKNETFW
jgi:polysaccharide pyruvyl transferase